MIAFLLNPGGKLMRSKRKKHKKLTKAQRSARARRAYRVRARRSATAKYKASARKIIDRLTCAPGASRRWAALRRQCAAKKMASVGSESMYGSEFPSSGFFATNPRGKKHRRNRRRNYSHWIPAYANPGRKHRRARFNYRRHRARNTSWVPSFAMNPGGGSLSVKKPGQALAYGFSPTLLAKGAVTLAGWVGNAWATKQLSGLSFMPSMLKSGVGSYAVGLASAGLTGALTSIVMPGYGMSVAFGGVLQQFAKAYNQYVAPMSTALPTLGSMEDYATQADVAAARPLGCMNGGCMGGGEELFNEAMIPSDGGSGLLGCMNGNCMGDYLTPAAAAAARPLGALGYTMNDAVIENTATEDLGS